MLETVPGWGSFPLSQGSSHNPGPSHSPRTGEGMVLSKDLHKAIASSARSGEVEFPGDSLPMLSPGLGFPSPSPEHWGIHFHSSRWPEVLRDVQINNQKMELQMLAC